MEDSLYEKVICFEQEDDFEESKEMIRTNVEWRGSGVVFRSLNSGGRGRWTSVSLRPPWATEGVTGQPRLQRETLS